jgi:16S rRNA (cytosine1402-N4)-methyltransferase
VTRSTSHRPVLLEETVTLLAPQPGDVVVDCTLGEAGHAVALGRHVGPSGLLIGIDRDPQAIEISKATLESAFGDGGPRWHLVRANFTALGHALEDLSVTEVDVFLFDLGVCSRHLDDVSRGFTYQEDAPLDMRMDPDQTVTAACLVASLSAKALTGLIAKYGEDRWASRIASFIVEARSRDDIRTTGQLVKIIDAAIPAAARRGRPHPARRTFQALRIAVNDELEPLAGALRAAIDRLAPGGRIGVITFHSLEDRIVKHTFRDLCAERKLSILTRRPLTASPAEVDTNPRARSAKLRAAQKAT